MISFLSVALLTGLSFLGISIKTLKTMKFQFFPILAKCPASPQPIWFQNTSLQ